MEEDVVYNRCLRIQIIDAGIFFTKERVEKLFPKDLYKKNLYVPDYKAKRRREGYDIPDDEYYDAIYTFYETIPGIYNMVIGPNYIQIDLENLNSDAYVPIVRKFLEKEPDFLSMINEIKCRNYEGFIVRKYEDFSKWNEKIHHLPENLAEYESEVSVNRAGIVDGCIYESEYKLYRCQASCFDYEECISFTCTMNVESRAARGHIDTVDDVLAMIEEVKNFSKVFI